MGKRNNKGPPKLKNKTYDHLLSKDETFVLVINPPKKELSDGQVVPDAQFLQAWLSAMTGQMGVALEMYTIRTHPEPIICLENVDLKAAHILGLHRWREVIRDMQPGHGHWNVQSVIAEYDFSRCNHPKNINYKSTILANPDPKIYATIVQPYPHPHPVDLWRNDSGVVVSSRAKEIIKREIYPNPPTGDHAKSSVVCSRDGLYTAIDQPNDNAPKVEQDPRRNFDFDGLEQDINENDRAEVKAADPRRGFVFDDTKHDVKAGEVSERAHASGSAASVRVKQEAGQVKLEYVQVKQEGATSNRDPRLGFDFDGIEQDAKERVTAPVLVSGNSSTRIKEEGYRKPFSHSRFQPKADPEDDSKDSVLLAPRDSPRSSPIKHEFQPDVDVHRVRVEALASGEQLQHHPPDPILVKQEDHRSAEFGGAGDRGRGSLPPPAPDGPRKLSDSANGALNILHEGAVKRERLEEDEQASKRLKTE
ncbi:hypothetical protein PENSPDRAFT_752133 [Peniophora sp. CONT]|nr:hypothetical protein PENSPDRAFT_752133 [Peniophora sp. CONT]